MAQPTKWRAVAIPHGYLQEKFETTVAGNETNAPTLSTKSMFPVLTDWTPDPGTAPLDRSDELRGSEEPLAVVPETYNPAWTGTYRGYPDTTGWRLKHILGPPTTTAGDGVITDPDGSTIPVGAYRHQWKSTDASWASLSGSVLNAPITTQMVVAYKDQGVFMKLKGCACDTLGIGSPETGGVQITASGPALYMDDGIADPALTPAYESAAVTPFIRGNLTLGTFLTGSGVKDDFTISIAAPADRVRGMGAGSKWADTIEKGDGLLVVSFSVSLHQLDPQDLAALRASTGFPIKAKWGSDAVIASGYKHAMWLEGVNAQYTGGAPAALANTRRIGGTFDGHLTTAGTGVAATFTVVNATPSYL